jgi:hypothetical protein
MTEHEGLEDVVADCQADLRGARKSPNTVRTYGQCLRVADTGELAAATATAGSTDGARYRIRRPKKGGRASMTPHQGQQGWPG